MIVGHNSVQIPHDGVYVVGAKVKASSFDRPTTMSVAMAEAGIIPDVHLVRDLAATARVRHRNDTRNVRRSAFVAF